MRKVSITKRHPRGEARLETAPTGCVLLRSSMKKAVCSDTREVSITQAAAWESAVGNRAYGMCAASLLNEKAVCSDTREVLITQAAAMGGAVANRAYGMCAASGMNEKIGLQWHARSVDNSGCRDGRRGCKPRLRDVFSICSVSGAPVVRDRLIANRGCVLYLSCVRPK